MIYVNLPAAMGCDFDGEGGCDATSPVQLVLASSGGLVFRPPDDAGNWQVEINAGRPYLTRCPAHSRQVVAVRQQVGPAGPRTMPVNRKR